MTLQPPQRFPAPKDQSQKSGSVQWCAHERQMLTNILAHYFPTPPLVSSMTISCLAARQAWSCLKACRGCRDIAFPVSARTSGRNRVTRRTHLSKPLPQGWFCSIKPSCMLSPGKQQDWSKIWKVPFSCRSSPPLYPPISGQFTFPTPYSPPAKHDV